MQLIYVVIKRVAIADIIVIQTECIWNIIVNHCILPPTSPIHMKAVGAWVSTCKKCHMGGRYLHQVTTHGQTCFSCFVPSRRRFVSSSVAVPWALVCNPCSLPDKTLEMKNNNTWFKERYAQSDWLGRVNELKDIKQVFQRVNLGVWYIFVRLYSS
jgi:hypothetical protein